MTEHSSNDVPDLYAGEPVIKNPEMVELLKQIIKEEKLATKQLTSTFSDERCKVINKNVKNKNNCYKMDRLGFIIRQQAYNKQNDPFGWKYDSNNEPIHILVSSDLTDEENVNTVLNALYMAKPELFKNKGNIKKVYEIHYPERLLKFNKED